MTATIGSLFSGYVGLDRGVQLVIDAEPIWHSDIKPAAVKLLAHRFPEVPNLGDITAVDWDAVERPDILTGGFPCTDLSTAGNQLGMIRGGDDRTRSGLWSEMHRAINILRPSLVVAENVRAIVSATADSFVEPCAGCVGDGTGHHMRALGAVLADLADIGYDAWWCGLRASDVGAPHQRYRIFIVAADTDDGGRGRGAGEFGARRRRQPTYGGHATPDTDDPGLEGWFAELERPGERAAGQGGVGSAAHADGGGLEGVGWVQPVRRDVDGRGRQNGAGQPGEPSPYGHYGPAVARWGAVLGRPAPAPTEFGPKGGHRLSPWLTEWMMGLPEGWICDVPGLSRNDQLSLAGDGVVPQQAAEALRRLLPVMAAA